MRSLQDRNQMKGQRVGGRAEPPSQRLAALCGPGPGWARRGLGTRAWPRHVLMIEACLS